MLTEEIRLTIIDALRNYRGDNYERSLAAFRNFSQHQMNQEFGATGQTCREYLDQARLHVKRCEEAIQIILIS
jgi:AraC-like DNA-binding protein